MLRVLIVDDEPLARENLRILLETQRDIEIVGECGNAVEAIGAVHKLRPDVLFLDIQMPRISGDGRDARPGAPPLYRVSHRL